MQHYTLIEIANSKRHVIMYDTIDRLCDGMKLVWDSDKRRGYTPTVFALVSDDDKTVWAGDELDDNLSKLVHDGFLRHARAELRELKKRYGITCEDITIIV